MEFRCGNVVTRFRIHCRVCLQLSAVIPHSRIMKELVENLPTVQRLINRWLRRTAFLCAVALCFSSAPGQETSDVREMVQKIEELRSAGKFREAIPIAEQVSKYCEKNYGPDHPETAISLNNLAEAYRESGDYAKAEPLYKRAIKIWENKLGSKHPNTLSGMSNLALLYQDK